MKERAALVGRPPMSMEDHTPSQDTKSMILWTVGALALVAVIAYLTA
jgi:hypothetical protein